MFDSYRPTVWHSILAIGRAMILLGFILWFYLEFDEQQIFYLINMTLSFGAIADCSNFKTETCAKLQATQGGAMDGKYSHIPFLVNLNQDDDLKV